MQSVSVDAFTVADRGPGSIKHISPKTSPGRRVTKAFDFGALTNTALTNTALTNTDLDCHG